MKYEQHKEHNSGLVLPERLSVYPHLSVTDIHGIVEKKYGLRATNPESLGREQTEGVAMGDFIVLHDVSNFLSLDKTRVREKRPDLHIEDLDPDFEKSVVQKSFAGDLSLGDCLTGVESLPKNYEDALGSFFEKKAIPTVAPRDFVTPEMTVSDYIGSLNTITPSLLVVQDTTDRLGYDHEEYCGFSKRGRGAISSRMIVDATAGIAEQDKELLTKRYARYLDEPAGKQLSLNSRDRLFSVVDTDVTKILTGKTVQMLKKHL